MNPWLAVITFIILLLGFFSSDISRQDVLTGTAVQSSPSDTFTKYFNFQAWKTTGIAHGVGNRGDGVVTIELPREPVSCTLDGTWKTDNKMFKSLGRPQLYCHNAQGTTLGYVDRSGQYVVNDAHSFRWAGEREPVFDPLPERVDDYVLSLLGCDYLYYTSKGKRYYARAHVENFGSTTFDLRWEYFNDNTLEAVDFFLDLTCQLKPEHKPVATKVTLPSAPVEEEPRAPEVFDVDVEDLEPETSYETQSPRGWARFKQWLVRVFF